MKLNHTGWQNLKFLYYVIVDYDIMNSTPKNAMERYRTQLYFKIHITTMQKELFIQCAIICKYLRYVSSTAMILSDNWQSWWMTVIVITWWTLDSNRCTKHYSWKQTFAKNEFSLSRQIGPSPGYILKDTMLNGR